MTIADLLHKKIAILGFGMEGKAILRYLQSHQLKAEVFENDQFNGIADYDVIFRSPGIWRYHKNILEAEQAGAVITSQTKFFFENYPGKIVGVTGTKGKGTTSTLIHKILSETLSEQVYLTGNIGKLQPLDFLDHSTDRDIVVFELSSFQLQDLNMSPHIGVCLMITADHLNHHADLAEYHNAKSAISAFQNANDFIIYNTDYDASKQIGLLGKGHKISITSKHDTSANVLIKQNMIDLKNLSVVNQPISISQMDLSDRQLRGQHNMENIAGAILATLCLGVDLHKAVQVAKKFSGLEHRLQFIGIFNGVKYYNDSISTIPETTIAALKSFTEPLHLLLGGSDKGLDYSDLIEFLENQENLASITLLGETGAKIYNTLQQNHQFRPNLLGHFTDFSRAIREVKNHAKDGDVVLLSPASASFDMFKNYADRGEQFIKLVNQG